MVEPDTNIILTGFMGTGKSSVAKLTAAQLNRQFVDMDALIAERSGMSINAIFERFGEAEFRRREFALGSELCERRGLVIATGGGALLDEHLARKMCASGIVICLHANSEVLLRRLEDANDRPLLAAADRANRLGKLWSERRPMYARLPLHIDTSTLTSEQVAQRVLELAAQNPRTLPVATPQGMYHVLVMRDAASTLPGLLNARAISRHIMLVSNERVWPIYGATLADELAKAGFMCGTAIVPDGEPYKTLDTVRNIYEKCAEFGLDRHSAIIALGGGVVTDMAGFAAATYLRGISYVPIPTSLLAMVDASVGGKVAVDLPQGKNLVGSFAQPMQVLLDPAYLASLSLAELQNGLAEIVKAGIIGDPVLFSVCEELGNQPDWQWLIERALAVKIAVVEEDPYETGRRAVLNLGHTFAHALEVLANYTLPHGQAVAVGMAAAAELGRIRGHCDALDCSRIIMVLRGLGLPVTWSGSSPDEVIAAMRQDKKRVDARLRFILPTKIGSVLIDDSVSDAEIRQSLERIIL